MYPNFSGKELGKIARDKMLEYLEPKWGHFQRIASGWSLFRFPKGQKLLSCYSSLNFDRWWFGVSKKYWENWDNDTFMALLLGERELFKMVILKPEESLELFNRITPTKTNQQKEINIRIPATGKLYIQEMSEFPIDHRLVDLGKIEFSNKCTMAIDSKKDEDLDRFIKYFKTMTETQKQKLIDRLKEKVAEVN